LDFPLLKKKEAKKKQKKNTHTQQTKQPTTTHPLTNCTLSIYIQYWIKDGETLGAEPVPTYRGCGLVFY
jgi:hypothetical protein